MDLKQEFLIDAGHEVSGVSRNAEFDTPLHLAVESPSPAVAMLLATRFPRCISMQNKHGADAVRFPPSPRLFRVFSLFLVFFYLLTDLWFRNLQIMLLARTSFASILPTIIALAASVAASLPSPAPAAPLQQQQQQPSHVLSNSTTVTPVPLQASDLDGNTALHYASAYGQLKCIRALLEAGADPNRRNVWSWTAVSYSLSVQAEVYFKGLVGEGVRGGAREV